MQATVSRNESPAAAGLRALFGRLVTRRVVNWTDSNEIGEEVPVVRPVGAGANIVTSSLGTNRRHQIVLDIDHPAWLVKSTTPDHHHLYIEVPDGIPFEEWTEVMLALANAGVIEDGYYHASIKRGFSAVRLPWIKKGRENDG